MRRAAPGFAFLLAACARLPELPRPAGERRAEILKIYEEARSSPRDATRNGRLGMILQAYEQSGAAAVCFERARALAPGDPRWTYYLGIARASLQQWREAAASFEQFLKAEPDSLPAKLALAKAVLEQGEAERSRTLYAQVIAAKPDAMEGYYGLGRAFETQANLEQAAGQFRLACQLFQPCGPARYALAVVLRRLGRAAEAEVHFAAYRRAPEGPAALADPLLIELEALKTEDPLIHVRRGIALEREGRLEAAVREQRRALELNPRLDEARVNLISLYGKLGKPESARQSYQAALAAGGGQPDLHFNYGVVLLDQRNFAAAAEAFEQALAANPAHAPARTNLGQALERMGQTGRALEQYRLAVENVPNYRLALFHLARLLLDRNQNREALDLLLRAATPEDHETPVYLLAASKVYARMGQPRQSAELAEKARSLAVALGQSRLVPLLEREIKVR